METTNKKQISTTSTNTLNIQIINKANKDTKSCGNTNIKKEINLEKNKEDPTAKKSSPINTDSKNAKVESKFFRLII